MMGSRLVDQRAMLLALPLATSAQLLAVKWALRRDDLTEAEMAMNLELLKGWTSGPQMVGTKALRKGHWWERRWEKKLDMCSEGKTATRLVV